VSLEMYIWGGLIALAVFAAGVAVGSATEAASWRLRGDARHRTAVCSGGKFYCVMPESEFVNEWQRRPIIPPRGGSGTAPPRDPKLDAGDAIAGRYRG